jgi:hypothetical protein
VGAAGRRARIRALAAAPRGSHHRARRRDRAGVAPGSARGGPPLRHARPAGANPLRGESQRISLANSLGRISSTFIRAR